MKSIEKRYNTGGDQIPTVKDMAKPCNSRCGSNNCKLQLDEIKSIQFALTVPLDAGSAT
jgi:hypothetical protein